MFKRMAAAETGLSDMTGMIEELLKAQGQRQEARERAEPLLGARPKAGTGPQRSGAQGQGLGNLDPGTVGAARAAGISEEALEEMARLVGSKKTKADELPVPEIIEEELSSPEGTSPKGLATSGTSWWKTSRIQWSERSCNLQR